MEILDMLGDRLHQYRCGNAEMPTYNELVDIAVEIERREYALVKAAFYVGLHTDANRCEEEGLLDDYYQEIYDNAAALIEGDIDE